MNVWIGPGAVAVGSGLLVGIIVVCAIMCYRRRRRKKRARKNSAAKARRRPHPSAPPSPHLALLPPYPSRHCNNTHVTLQGNARLPDPSTAFNTLSSLMNDMKYQKDGNETPSFEVNYENVNYNPKLDPWPEVPRNNMPQVHVEDTPNSLEAASAHALVSHSLTDSSFLTLKTLAGSEICFTDEDLPTVNICSPIPGLLPLPDPRALEAADNSYDEYQGYLRPTDKERRLTMMQFVVKDKMRVKLKLKMPE
ncbi:uncharacterized protein LOC126999059 [Eriocheir sinensis]|uniref:uncharacterized protein LOC126999059 n=1 Tax=Eriocheir sinensis TaxID=95602 RepID=UPI0021C7ABE1|nr:uncharacterized protein LOC126999059 [Eriocheir sinensis]